MRPAEVVRRASDYLDRHDVETPTQTAEVLLAAEEPKAGKSAGRLPNESSGPR